MNITLNRIFFALLFITFVFVSCKENNTYNMTEAEKELILSKDINSPFEVLLITDKADSITLRTPSKDINIEELVSDSVLQHLIQRMKVTLAEEQGVGLAAPQVGILRNVFLMMRLDKPNRPIQVVVNPKIINHPDSFIPFSGDGCLSIPEISGTSSRYPWIEVEFYDEFGVKHTEKLNGGQRQEDFTGIIFQHEFDHLNGVLFIDKLVKNINLQ